MIRVYRNLNKGCLSVQEKTSKGWRVVRYVDEIHLKNARFIVSESGRQRVIRENRKNVHAYVEGEEIGSDQSKASDPVSYNPYKFRNFTTESGQPIDSAGHCSIGKFGIKVG